MLHLFLLAMIYILIQMFCVWLLYRFTKNPSIVDVAWAMGLMVTGLIYLWSQPFNLRLFVISTLLIIWGLRLGGYLWFTRIRKAIVDKRYVKLSENWKIAKSLGYLLNFQLQGFFILIISSVFLFAVAGTAQTLSWLDGLGVLLVLIGVIGETIADQELYHFQQQHRGKVCDLGLWKYSRHPNYFFEWIVWCGFTIFGLQHIFGCIGIVSPLLLYLIMTKMTGPLTEKVSIMSKGEAYLAYQRTTPQFFPGRK
jgi:steroid 5-alpha reductase family enzyme